MFTPLINLHFHKLTSKQHLKGSSLFWASGYTSSLVCKRLEGSTLSGGRVIDHYWKNVYQDGITGELKIEVTNLTIPTGWLPTAHNNEYIFLRSS